MGQAVTTLCFEASVDAMVEQGWNPMGMRLEVKLDRKCLMNDWNKEVGAGQAILSFQLEIWSK